MNDIDQGKLLSDFVVMINLFRKQIKKNLRYPYCETINHEFLF